MNIYKFIAVLETIYEDGGHSTEIESTSQLPSANNNISDQGIIRMVH